MILNNAHSILTRLKSMGREVVETKGGGNCLIHALIMMTGYEKSHLRLRKELVSIVKNFIQEDIVEGLPYSCNLPDIIVKRNTEYEISSWKQYLREMAKSGTWCDEHMVLAASIKFQRPITVIQSNTSYSEPCKPPDHWGHALREDPIVLANESEHFSATRHIPKELTPIQIIRYHKQRAKLLLHKMKRERVKPKHYYQYISHEVAKIPRHTPGITARRLPCDAGLALILQNHIWKQLHKKVHLY